MQRLNEVNLSDDDDDDEEEFDRSATSSINRTLRPQSGVFLSVDSSDKEASKYGSRLTRWLPLAHVVAGLFSILFQILAVAMESHALYHVPPNVAPGIWCGTLFVVTGLLGLAAARRTHKFFVYCYMILCVLCSASVIVMMGVVGVNVTRDQPASQMEEGYSVLGLSKLQTAFACNVVLLVVGTLELLVSALSTVLCAKSVCKLPSKGNPVSYRPLVTG